MVDSSSGISSRSFRGSHACSLIICSCLDSFPATAPLYPKNSGGSLSGGISFIILVYASKLYARLVSRVSYRKLSALGLAAVIVIVLIFTGPAGLLVAMTAAGIGLMANLFHTRRMNLLGCLLLPMILDLSGYTGTLANLLGL